MRSRSALEEDLWTQKNFKPYVGVRVTQNLPGAYALTPGISLELSEYLIAASWTESVDASCHTARLSFTRSVGARSGAIITPGSSVLHPAWRSALDVFDEIFTTWEATSSAFHSTIMLKEGAIYFAGGLGTTGSSEPDWTSCTDLIDGTQEWFYCGQNAVLQPGAEILILYSMNRPGAVTEDCISARTSVYRGIIDTVDWGSEEVTVVSRDISSRLMDRWFERDQMLGISDTAPYYVWKSNEAVDGGQYVGSTAVYNGHSYSATTAGTTGDTEPTWPTGSGSTVSDNTVTWTEQGIISIGPFTDLNDLLMGIQDLAGVAADDQITVDLSFKPGWVVRAYEQSKAPVLEVMQALAGQIGLLLRLREASYLDFIVPYREDLVEIWSASLDQDTYFGKLIVPTTSNGYFYLIQNNGVSGLTGGATEPSWPTTIGDTVADPDESDLIYVCAGLVGTALNLSEAEVWDVTQCALDFAPVRNAIQVVYGVAANRKSVTVTDPASITIYGRRWAQIAIASTDMIDTFVEAQRLGLAALADLAYPLADISFTTPLFYHAELFDKTDLTLPKHWDGVKTCWVKSLTHNVDLSKGICETQWTVQERASFGSPAWHTRIARAGVAPAAKDNA